MPANWFIGLPAGPAPWLEEALVGLPTRCRALLADDLHFTVAFLGGCGEARARAAFAAVQPPAEALRALCGPGEAMGNPRRPSAYALGLGEGRDAVADYIRAQRDLACDAAGVPRERRPARPHLTIARPPKVAPPELRRAGEAWLAAVVPPVAPLVLDRVVLFTAAAPGSRRRYVEVAEKRAGSQT